MKKEEYFTNQTIATESAAMLTEVDSFTKRHRARLKPQSAALLVLDMQDYCFNDLSHAFVPSAPAILPGIIHLQKIFLKKKLGVIHTRHLNDPQKAGMMGQWWREVLTRDHPLSQITADLIDPGVLSIQKTQYDAFYETGLAEILVDQGVKQLILTGVLTHLCCETTARSAFVRGFEVFFPIDGTATYNRLFHLLQFDAHWQKKYYMEIEVKRGKNYIKPQFIENFLPSLSRRLEYSKENNSLQAEEKFSYLLYDQNNRRSDHQAKIVLALKAAEDAQTKDQLNITYDWQVVLNGLTISQGQLRMRNQRSNPEAQNKIKVLYEDKFHYYLKYYLQGDAAEAEIGAAYIEYKE